MKMVLRIKRLWRWLMTTFNQPLSFTTKLPIDKIFYKKEGTQAITNNANPLAPVYTTVSLTNTANKTFFIDMQVSPDGTNWYDAGSEPYYKDGVTLQNHPRFYGTWEMTSSTITLSFTANDADYTLHYRLVGYYKE